MHVAKMKSVGRKKIGQMKLPKRKKITQIEKKMENLKITLESCYIYRRGTARSRKALS